MLDCGPQRKGRGFQEVAECVLTCDWCGEGQCVSAQRGGGIEGPCGALHGRDRQSS